MNVCVFLGILPFLKCYSINNLHVSTPTLPYRVILFFIHSFTHSFIHACMHSFISSVIYPIIYFITHVFIHLNPRSDDRLGREWFKPTLATQIPVLIDNVSLEFTSSPRVTSGIVPTLPCASHSPSLYTRLYLRLIPTPHRMAWLGYMITYITITCTFCYIISWFNF